MFDAEIQKHDWVGDGLHIIRTLTICGVFRTPKGSLDCDVNDTNDTGCSVATNDPSSFGPPFNGIGGGWYCP